jgi:predicted metal-dependent phosphoesterase TrpH
MRTPCDLHLHSSYSDGILTPEEIISRVATLGLSACSITDHDTLLGQTEAMQASARHGIEYLTGLELSVRIEGVNLHILGYLIDPGHSAFGESLRTLGQYRLERAQLMVQKLAARGVPIAFESIRREAGIGVIGRPHIARSLFKHGLIGNVQEAFDEYIGYGKPCYVPEKVLSIEKVVELIEGAGGVAVWAHPGSHIWRKSLVEKIRSAGVKGLEVWHPKHTIDIERAVIAIADEHDLLCTGGSDFHGENAKPLETGVTGAPYDVVPALRALGAKIRGG